MGRHSAEETPPPRWPEGRPEQQIGQGTEPPSPAPVAEGITEAPLYPAPGGRRPALPSLTGARWWAALIVFWLHALVFLPVYPFQKSELFARIHMLVPMQLGSAGVTFFFILSGFIIYWSNSEMTDRRYFLGRRLLKIYPSHILAAVLFAVVAAVPLGRPVTWLPNLLLVHTWVPNWTSLGGANIPSWSLVAELLFYLTFPLFLPLVHRVGARRSWVAIGTLFVVIVGIHLAIYLFASGYKGIENTFVPRFWPGDASPAWDVHASPAWFAQPSIPVDLGYWLSYNFPLTRLPEFYLGVFGARLVVSGQWRNTSLWLPMATLVGAFALTWLVPVNFKMSVLFLLPTVLVVCTLAARDLSDRTGMTGRGRMIWLGNISFAFYLVQFPVMVAAQRWFISGKQHGFLGWSGWTLLILVISVLLADLVFRFVDDPLMNTSARSHRARIAALASPAATADTTRPSAAGTDPARTHLPQEDTP